MSVKQPISPSVWEAAGLKPWDRLPGEPERAFAAFTHYLNVPVEERTILAAYRIGAGRPNGTESNAQPWRRWSRAYAWMDRATRYDRWKYEQALIAQEHIAAEQALRWSRVRNDHREEEMSLGKALIEKARAMLQFPLATVERVEEAYPDGRPKTTQIIKPAGWNFGTVAKMIDLGSRLVRLASEMEDPDQRRVDLRAIYEEADRIAKENNLTRDDVLAEADRIVQEHLNKG